MNRNRLPQMGNDIRFFVNILSIRYFTILYISLASLSASRSAVYMWNVLLCLLYLSINLYLSGYNKAHICMYARYKSCSYKEISTRRCILRDFYPVVGKRELCEHRKSLNQCRICSQTRRTAFITEHPTIHHRFILGMYASNRKPQFHQYKH